MNQARERILKRLRKDQPGRLPDRPPRKNLSPPRSMADNIQRFRERLEAVRAEVHLCRTEDWAGILRQLMQQKTLGNLRYGDQGPLAGAIRMAWEGHDDAPRLISHDNDIGNWKDELFDRTEAAVTSARWGIAETGTLVLWPTPEEPRSLSLVPPVHFAVLDSASLHDSFAGLVEQEQWSSGMPSNALLISGPSKTADIEQTLAYGIHGPIEMIVLLIH